MKILSLKLSLLILLTNSHVADCFDYGVASGDDTKLVLTDEDTGITGLRTIFSGASTLVSVTGVAWTKNDANSSSTSGNNNNSNNDALLWETFVDDVSVQSGNRSLADVGRELPTTVDDAGTIQISSHGLHTIRVVLTVDDSTATVEGVYRVYGSGAAIIPLLVVLILAMTTRMVELSLFTAIFIGACMVTGSVKGGFKETLENYILNALADVDHGYIILFTLFLSGLVGMMEKSGGMFGFTRDMGYFAKGPKSAQFCCFAIGIFIFFDDYANVLLAGETMRPLLDALMVSREKLSFIVDATAAPIASISPISSWVGFEIGLIQDELDKIVAREGTADISIKTTGFGVFLQSIKYRYYPIFMIVLMFVVIYSGRDFGGMLIAERKCRVYQRTDGGDGKGKADQLECSKENQPKLDTPTKSYNLIFPIFLMIFLIFYLLIKTGEVAGESQTLLDKIENSNSYSSLLWGTMGATICTMLFYLGQIVRNGSLVVPTSSVLKDLFSGTKDKDEVALASQPRFLMSVMDSVESFLHGMSRIFPALIVLTLAWASGSVIVDVGADRLFSKWIVGGVAPEALPTVSFIISFFMALATGTSWGTMSILFPLLLVPTYEASGGDPDIFYAVTAGVLSGSVAGDHVSPISDTTVLTALACDCKLLSHVSSQAPYVVVTVIVSIIFGTIPYGYGAWPNIIGILLGALALVVFVYGYCVPIESPTGRYDMIGEGLLWLSGRRGNENIELIKLREDTIIFLNGGAVTHGEHDDVTVVKKELSCEDESEDHDVNVAEDKVEEEDQLLANEDKVEKGMVADEKDELIA